MPAPAVTRHEQEHTTMTIELTRTPSPTRSQKWFARLWTWLDDAVDDALADAKDAVYIDLPDRIVEIGPGRGSNFKRYRPGTTVIAYEPNLSMHDDLRNTAAEHDIDLDLRSAGVEEMGLGDASQDVVVSSLTLCSVADAPAALAEIRRVLRPGGRFLFVEHIVAESGSTAAKAQAVLRRPWAAIADRCDLMATTHEAIDHAGFDTVDRAIDDFGSRMDPSRRTVYGVAVR
jgi:SAM-dependent methyltransferase